MKRTSHKFAEVWKDGGHFVMKLRNGKFAEISDPNGANFIQVGGEHETVEAALAAAKASHTKFVADKVVCL